MSKRIVVNCWGSYGDVYPYVGLAKALNARGHRTVVAAPSYYQQTVEAHDQPDNAFRVTNLGVARTVFPRRYKGARVARELERLLGDAHYRERAAVVASQVRAEGGADTAAEAIERAID